MKIQSSTLTVASLLLAMAFNLTFSAGGLQAADTKADAKAADPKAPVTNAVGGTVYAGVLDSSDSYKPVPMDKFMYRIVEDPAKGGELDVTVNAMNEMSFKISRDSDEAFVIPAKGKTLTQIKKELKTFLDANYYQNATIYLRLRDQAVRPGLVVIMGAIKQNILLVPGIQKTVYSAILEVGINDYANLKKVKLWRFNPETKKDVETVIDIQSMLRGGSREKDIILQDGDRIEVVEKILFIQ